MKISELISKIVTLDPNKDYDVAEVVSVPVPEQNVPESSTAEPIQQQQQQFTTPQPVQTNNDELTKLQERIKVLEQTNVALLNRIPVGQPEKTPEELIYDLCVPENRRIYNDNTSTGVKS